MTIQNNISIRDYRPGDYDAVMALNAYGLAAAGVPTDADVYAGDLDNNAAAYLTGRAALLIGELLGSVIAMGAVREISTTTCEITRMRVDPTAQGRGYGRAILLALEERAREFGYHDAVLLTGPDQHPAIDLYEAAGYTVVAAEHHGGLKGVRLCKSLVRCA
jgi:ribosomal protein S18 acetylase RimI-like enzyme